MGVYRAVDVFDKAKRELSRCCEQWWCYCKVSSRELQGSGNFVRALFVAVNIVMGVFGLVAFAVGVWAIVANGDFSFLTGDGLVIGGAILIAVGIITALACIYGITVGIYAHCPTVTLYALVILLELALAFTAGVMAIGVRDRVEETVPDRSLEAIALYRVSNDSDRRDDINNAIDRMQTMFECCGYNNASDWIKNPEAIIANGGVPPSCDPCTPGVQEQCATFSAPALGIIFRVTDVGCSDALSERLIMSSTVVGAVGMAMGGLVFIGFLLTLIYSFVIGFTCIFSSMC